MVCSTLGWVDSLQNLDIDAFKSCYYLTDLRTVHLVYLLNFNQYNILAQICQWKMNDASFNQAAYSALKKM